LRYRVLIRNTVRELAGKSWLNLLPETPLLDTDGTIRFGLSNELLDGSVLGVA
jgi:hypothetical protein